MSVVFVRVLSIYRYSKNSVLFVAVFYFVVVENVCM